MGKMTITPNVDRVLLRVPKTQWNSLFSKYVFDKDGNKVELFFDVEEPDGHDRRLQQNVSVAQVVAVGSNVPDIQKGDIAIVDYLVTGTADMLVGSSNGEMVFSVPAKTTYHQADSPPTERGAFTFREGDFEQVSPIYGFIRAGRVHTFPPYVIFKKNNISNAKVSPSGIVYEEAQGHVTEMEVLSDSENFSCGDRVLINRFDLFEREVDGKAICVCFDRDIIGSV